MLRRSGMAASISPPPGMRSAAHRVLRGDRPKQTGPFSRKSVRHDRAAKSGADQGERPIAAGICLGIDSWTAAQFAAVSLFEAVIGHFPTCRAPLYNGLTSEHTPATRSYKSSGRAGSRRSRDGGGSGRKARSHSLNGNHTLAFQPFPPAGIVVAVPEVA